MSITLTAAMCRNYEVIGALPPRARLVLAKPCAECYEEEDWIVVQRRPDSVTVKCAYCEHRKTITVGSPIEKVKDKNARDISTQFTSTTSTVSTPTSSTGEHMFTIQTVRVIDGFVGQVLMTVPGDNEPTIFVQTDSFAEGVRMEKTNEYEGQVAAREAAQDEVKDALLRLFDRP